MPMILGGVAALGALVALIVFSQQSGGDDGGAGQQPAPTKRAAPAANARPTTKLKTGAARAGKAPARPAPTLTAEMLQKANALVDEAKALNNEGTRLRNAGDNRGARAKNSEAKRKIDAAIASIEAPSVWHEEAELEEWAMPAEYVTLGHLYGRISKLQKRIRMGGGK